MLLPLAGFLIYCAVYSVLGVVILASLPRLKLNLLNFVFVLAGTLPGVVAGMIFGSMLWNPQLHGSGAVVPFLLTMLIGGIGGGVCSVVILKFARNASAERKALE
jgi:hypothetical protein